MRLVDLRDGYIDIEALVDFLFAVIGCEDDAHSEDIIDLLKANVLVLHLVPDGVGALHALLDFVFDPHSLKGVLNGRGKLCKQFVTGYTGRFQLVLNGSIFIRVLELKTQVLQFRFDLVEA